MKFLADRHTSRGEILKERSRYSQSLQKDYSSDKTYTGMITSLNQIDSQKKITSNKGYFRSIQPYCQEYLKLKHEVYRKYNQMRIRKKQEQENSKIKLPKKDQVNLGKLQHLKEMKENINLLDFKYPCIGYYELKGYKKSKQDIISALKGNKQSEIKNRLIKKNKTQQNQLNIRQQTIIPLAEIPQSQENNSQAYKFNHGHQKSTKSTNIIQNLLKKYQTRKSIKKSKQSTTTGPFSQLTNYNYSGKIGFKTDQNHGSLFSIPTSYTGFQKIFNEDSNSKINNRQIHNSSCNSDKGSLKIIPLNPNKSINIQESTHKIVYSIPRIRSPEQIKRLKIFSRKQEKMGKQNKNVKY